MQKFPSPEQLSNIPSLGETAAIPLREKTVYLHFTIGKVNFCDWYIVEYDGQNTFWGYSIFLDDHQNANWGKILLSGLRMIKLSADLFVSLDTTWVPKKACEVSRIRNF